MTLHEIATELQNLIDRLTVARSLLASLRPEADFDLPAAITAASPKPAPRRALRIPRPPTPEPAASVEMGHSPAETSSNAAPSPAPRPRAARRPHRRPAPPPSALTGSVPAGPVAVSAAEVRRKLVPVEPLPHTEPAGDTASGHSLDDLLRELARRQPASLSF